MICGPSALIQLRVWLLVTSAVVAVSCLDAAQQVSAPATGKLYHGFYYDGPAADGQDPTEHNVAPEDVKQYERAVGKKTAWVLFSDNWFESCQFPRALCEWIRRAGKIPYLRLMLRSDLDQKHAEKKFTLKNIIAGDFDNDLRTWARAAKTFGSPILIEWGTEPNGDWFAWNGKWNGGATVGPALYTAAYRHIVDLMRAEGADNLQWIWHVNWFDEPETKWNRFENYYPGDDYCSWVALSVYGPLTPMTKDGLESFRFKMSEAYPRLTKIAAGKPIVIAEFGCDLHHRKVRASQWANAALDDLFSNRWPGVIGFCWWNESWENDDQEKHDTDMNILHDSSLTNVFRTQFAEHAEKIQQTPIISTR
jgi:hypothetical protein